MELYDSVPMAERRLFGRIGYIVLSAVGAAAIFALLGTMDSLGYIRSGQASTPKAEDSVAFENPQETRQKCEKMRLVCISDTHHRHREVDIPPGDVLIFAGDFMNGGSEESQVDW